MIAAGVTVIVQDSAGVALDWITGILAFVTAVMAIATVVLGAKTAASVKVAKELVVVAKQEADATLELARGAREDRELAVQPVLVTLYSGDDGAKPEVVVRNIGRGAAIRTRVLQWKAGELFWTPGSGVPIAAGETYPRQADPMVLANYWSFHGRRGAASVPDIPGSDKDGEDLWAYSLDQLGNALKFNLRTGDPPELSRREDDPRKRWVSAIYDFP